MVAVVAATSTIGRNVAAHLLRRAGFGGTPDEIDELAALTLVDAVDRLMAGPATAAAEDAVPAPPFQTAALLASRGREVDDETRRALQRASRDERRALMRWWIERMTVAQHPVREKLSWLWHGHFATSVTKVKAAELMHQQHQTLTRHALGRFDELVDAVVRDPAMLVWLDGRSNRVGSPNENLARELLELFTHGHGHGHGHEPPYSEDDVQEAARALTGWVIEREGRESRFAPRRHDGGTKTILGRTDRHDAETVVDLVTAHHHAAPHVVARLWSRLARPATSSDPVVQELAVGFARDLDIGSLVRSMLVHPELIAPESRHGLVRTPVEWLVGSARALGVTQADWWLGALHGLGQVPFAPPDVAGWPENEAWLSTATAQARLQASARLALAADLSWLDATPASDRPTEVALRLGLPGWSDATERGLRRVASEPVSVITVALASPEAVVA